MLNDYYLLLLIFLLSLFSIFTKSKPDRVYLSGFHLFILYKDIAKFEETIYSLFIIDFLNLISICLKRQGKKKDRFINTT